MESDCSIDLFFECWSSFFMVLPKKRLFYGKKLETKFKRKVVFQNKAA